MCYIQIPEKKAINWAYIMYGKPFHLRKKSYQHCAKLVILHYMGS